MSGALKSLPRHLVTETLFVTRPADRVSASLPVLSNVVVLADVVTIEGDIVPSGTLGTIVAVWNDGDAYDVEFHDALGPASIVRRLLDPA